LSFHDFELLVDLIFRQAGWQRVSGVGGTQRTIDIELFSPTLGRAVVQVKSESDARKFMKYGRDFSSMAQFQHMYYVVHTASNELGEITPTDPRVRLVLLDELARWTINSGLTEWLVGKTS
jgi:hypothetical protein